MSKFDLSMERMAKNVGSSLEEVQDFFQRGQEITYQAEEWLFHESTPRMWGGVVLEGEVKVVRGVHGSTRHLSVIQAGGMVSEGAFLGNMTHSNGALTRAGATVWQMTIEQIETFRAEKPELFYRIMAQVAKNISERLRILSDIPGTDGTVYRPMSATYTGVFDLIRPP